MGLLKNTNISNTDLSLTSPLAGNFIGHTDEIRAIYISAPSHYLYSGGWDNQILKYSLNLPPGSEISKESLGILHIADLTGHTEGITAIKEIWADILVASSSKDGTIKLWGMASDRCMYSFPTGHGKVFTFDFLKQENGRVMLITGGEDGFFRMWEFFLRNTEGEIEISHHLLLQHRVEFGAPVHVVKIHRKLPLFACSGDSNRILVYSLTDGEKLRSLEPHQKMVYTFDFHPTEPWVLSGGKEKKICLIDIDSGVRYDIPIPKSLSNLQFSPGGQFFLAVDFNRYIRIYSVGGGNLIHVFSWQVGAKLTIGMDKEWKLLGASPFGHQAPFVRLWDFSKIFPLSTDIVGDNSRA